MNRQVIRATDLIDKGFLEIVEKLEGMKCRESTVDRIKRILVNEETIMIGKLIGSKYGLFTRGFYISHIREDYYVIGHDLLSSTKEVKDNSTNPKVILLKYLLKLYNEYDYLIIVPMFYCECNKEKRAEDVIKGLYLEFTIGFARAKQLYSRFTRYNPIVRANKYKCQSCKLIFFSPDEINEVTRCPYCSSNLIISIK